ncbi:DUF6920 family protein [candidate division CSSED10-310 bacterium]|uniref:DUF6920 family protein n=1 Tax=candidate division CSSED10-310 bacterium TaxID=2855610 RepID=A0ABV6YZ97_UNCC1
MIIKCIGRFRSINGKYELTPWTGRFKNYQEKKDIRIPLSAEVEWNLPQSDYSYWKATIVHIDYK